MTSAVVTTFEICIGAGRAWRPGEQAVLLLALALPILMNSGRLAGVPIGAVTLLLLFGLIVRLALQQRVVRHRGREPAVATPGFRGGAPR